MIYPKRIEIKTETPNGTKTRRFNFNAENPRHLSILETFFNNLEISKKKLKTNKP